MSENPANSTESHGSALSFMIGMLLVFIQIFVLPYRILLNSIKDLAKWGEAKKIPSSDSDFPVLTFVIVDFKPFLIVLFALWSVIMVFFTFGISLVIGYLAIPFISYGFEIAALFISAANNLKRLSKS